MFHMHNVMGLLLNTPLFAHSQYAMTVYNYLASRQNMPQAPFEVDGDYRHLNAHRESLQTRPLISRSGKTELRATVESSRFFGDVAFDDSGRRQEPYLRTAGGAAIISITGSLVNRGAYVGASSGVTSYEGIDYQLERVAQDTRSKAVVIDISSPGGEAMGNTEIAQKIRMLREIKPVFTIANSLAASAGYAILSAGTEAFATPSALVGSIGCILLHMDMTEKAKNEGVVPTLITAGDHKADGHPLMPLTPDALAELKKGVSSYYSLFLEAVAAGRGVALTVEKARATQARTYVGREAKEAGLVDEIASFHDVLSATDAVARKRSGPARSQARGVTSMSQLFAEANAQAPQATNGPGPTATGGPIPQDQAAAFLAWQQSQQASAQPGATAPQPAPVAPVAPQPAPSASADPRLATLMQNPTLQQYGHLLRPAMDLMLAAPGMSAEAIVAFVVSNPPSAAAPQPPAATTPAAAPAQQWIPGYGFCVATPQGFVPVAQQPSAQGQTAPAAPPALGALPNAFAQQAVASGVQALSGATGGPAHHMAPGAQPAAPAQTIDLKTCSWDSAVGAVNGTRNYKPSHVDPTAQ